MTVTLHVDHFDLCFFNQTFHVFNGAFASVSFSEKIQSAVDGSAFGEGQDLLEDDRDSLWDVIFVHAFPELLTVRGGHQKLSVIQASPMGGGRGVLAKGTEPLGTAWPWHDCISECCQFKATNPRGNHILSRKKILWRYFMLGNVCVMEDIISPACNLFFL